MRTNLYLTVIALSVLHGFIPSHWTPVMLLKKQYKWGFFSTLKVVSLLNFSHVLSTVLIGIFFSIMSSYLKKFFFDDTKLKFISSVALLTFGVYFIYRHYYHYHFHLYHEKDIIKQRELKKQLIILNISMLFSPCMEITGLYLVSGILDWMFVLTISIIYFILSFLSSIFWIIFFDTLSEKLNFHNIEHNSGLLSGISLIISAVVLFFV